MKTIFREFDRAERAEAFYNLAESKGGRGFDIKYAAAGENNHGTETFILLVMEVPENETISLCEHRDENNYHANCLNEGVTEALNPHGGKVWKCAEHALEPTEPEAEAAPVKPPFVAQPMRPRAESETTEAEPPDECPNCGRSWEGGPCTADNCPSKWEEVGKPYPGTEDAPDDAIFCLYVGCYETAGPYGHYCAAHQLHLEEAVSGGL
jgi:hypothetical protein